MCDVTQFADGGVHVCVSQVCRSLFEKDKLLFAFLMTVHLKAHVQHALDWASLRFLLTGVCAWQPARMQPADWFAFMLLL